MEHLFRFLKPYAVPTGTPDANLGSLRGGLWRIPYVQVGQFFKLYAAAVLTMIPDNNTSFVFRPHSMDVQPFCLDVDFRTKNKFKLNANMLLDLAEKVCNKFEQCSVACVMKEKGYFATVKKERVYKTGGHLYFKNNVPLRQLLQ